MRTEPPGKDFEMRQGHMPYGYKVINGTAVIDEEQAAQVRGVFRDFPGWRFLCEVRIEQRIHIVPRVGQTDAAEQVLSWGRLLSP